MAILLNPWRCWVGWRWYLAIFSAASAFSNSSSEMPAVGVERIVSVPPIRLSSEARRKVQSRETITSCDGSIQERFSRSAQPGAACGLREFDNRVEGGLW
ncbi:MAG: hypothetical protein WD030_02965, partial [Pirellulales bacterium]